MLRLFVEHGGDVDIKDSDGVSARSLVKRFKGLILEMAEVLSVYDKASGYIRKKGLIAGFKVGRNDKCPCGSRKKFEVCWRQN